MSLFKAVRSPLFFKMLERSLVLRGGHTRTALLALTIAACTATAMLTLYLDLDAKLHKEFRAYGANIVVSARDNQALPDQAIEAARSILPARALLVPFAYAVAHTPQGLSVVVAGTDMNLVKELNRWWSVSHWPSTAGEALVGERVLETLGRQQGRYTLIFGERATEFYFPGTLKTGSDEENRIYISLADFERWTGKRASTLEVSVPGSREQINAVVGDLRSRLPMADVQPVRQIVDAEAGVISKTKLLILAALALIGVTVTLCVLATLTASVLERRRDFAMMKALGSSQRLINLLFASEAVFLAVFGGLAGSVLGLGIAAWIEHANFHATVLPRLSVFPVVLLGTVLIALLASLFPLTKLKHLEPAGILKGE